ncbi:Lupeol synthase [Arachis hypogaea]|nr:Lupeol synthase [Arachis hypogaea]QHO53372.1 Lupeol synthase [Arachis hypogaea]QHO53373.1 Lupeol synthase [Arachis hypogaea]
MWKLKLAEGGENLVPENNFIGRQHWEFDPNAGTPQERAEVERLRQEFTKNRFFIRQNSDLLMRMQLKKENNFQTTLGKVEVGDEENVTAGIVVFAVQRYIFTAIRVSNYR